MNQRGKRSRGLLIGIVAVMAATVSAKPLKTGNAGDAKPKSVAEQLATFTVPDGFVVELVAGEAQGVVKPISLAFDDSGRLWTQTAREYPRDKDTTIWQKGGRDQILVFDAPTAAGVRTPRVFADGLAMPTGLLPHGDGVYVAHGPELLFLRDADGDGVADKREVMLSGFGVQDTHTGLHQLEFAPGGWINFSQGVLAHGTVVDRQGVRTKVERSVFARMRPDGSRLTILGAGTNNAWAWAMDRFGRVFTHEANDHGYSQMFWERDATYPAYIQTYRFPESKGMMHPPTAQGLGLGGTGFSGIAVSEGGSAGFPGQWQGVNFVANPITGTINTVSYDYDDKGVMRFKKEADLVQCSDPMFRPVYVLFGPDGCLYVADWYNGIISHNEVPRDHPHRNKTHGRIWRIRHASQAPGATTNVAAAESAKLLEMLQSDNGWVQRAAWRQIVARGDQAMVPKLKKLMRSERVDVVVHAIWCLEGLDCLDPGEWLRAINHSDQHVRYEAVRSLASFDPPLDLIQTMTFGLHVDPSYRVRNEVTRLFRERHGELTDAHRAAIAEFAIPDAELSKEQVKGWKGPYLALGGPYEGAFLNLLVKKALEGESGPVDTSRWLTEIAQEPVPAATLAKQEQRIAELTAYVRANPTGDVKNGESHFKALCSHCHSIDPAGSGFAPPLNGGASRSIEGTLAAIISPSAAMESVFRVYRVEQKDGTLTEGFLSEVDGKTITLTFMGGTQQSIPLHKVKRAGYVRGRSVMPPGLDAALDNDGVRDLVAYLRQTPVGEVPLRKVEFESLGAPVAGSTGPSHVQRPGGRFNPKILSGERHIFMPFKTVGEVVTYRLPAVDGNPLPLTIGLTTCLDYGVVDVLVNGILAKPRIDVYSPELAVKEVALGRHQPQNGMLEVGLRLAALNSQGKGGRSYAGVDYVKVGGKDAVIAQPGFKTPPPTKVRFRKLVLFDKYVSEGASVGDLDGDGKVDVVAGPAWWRGPELKERFAYEPVKTFPIKGPGLTGYSNNFFTFPDELSGDKWSEVIKVGIPGQDSQVAMNPGKTPQAFDGPVTACTMHGGPKHVCNESPQYLDVIGDAKKEMLSYGDGQIVLHVATAGNPPVWERLPISPKGGFPAFAHGLGAGDVDGDGLQDVLEKNGWWQQPKNWDRKTPWTFHKYPFAPQQGGAQMFAFDVDGDGLNDVVTALNAHSYGLAWYEQVRANGRIDFKKHVIMTDRPEGNPYGVCFSQPHAMDAADVDGDGILDLVTGKCYYAHNGRDPGAEDPAVLYWFRTVRHADGTAELVPYLIDGDSGVGRQITLADVNGDGKVDVVSSNKKGVFAFIQE